ncbi:ribbon-helix-helix domain-containing protein [Patescibacteria group bacterium]|nr:ribbon-helix-helix domain-containing protein [Patescibacteria group bacterium]
MQRVTLRVPEQQLEMLDALVKIGDFPSVSEAIRAGVRDLVDRRCGKFGHNIIMAGDCYE